MGSMATLDLLCQIARLGPARLACWGWVVGPAPSVLRHVVGVLVVEACLPRPTHVLRLGAALRPRSNAVASLRGCFLSLSCFLAFLLVSQWLFLFACRCRANARWLPRVLGCSLFLSRNTEHTPSSVVGPKHHWLCVSRTYWF